MPPSSGLAKFVFVGFVAIQAVVWSQSRYSQSLDGLFAVVKAKRAEQCDPLSVPVVDQCTHVQHACETGDTVLSIPYLQHYYCAAQPVRPLVFGSLVLWLFFLFSTLGISASDFFCPNLATLAHRLGLDENVAGVTFLALGNGSPDVFSTFSAMRAGAGALAVGELLGAASFIVSVVAGTMCIVRPFSVDARPFVRDVGFFTVAVGLLFVILCDGMIHAWEAATLVGLYVFYVVVVIVGSWWERRQFRRKQLEDIVRGEYAQEERPEPYRDNPSPELLTIPVPSPRVRAYSSPVAAPSLEINTSYHRPRTSRSRSPSPSLAPRMSQMPSFSLIGALEFRQVVASLQHESAGATLSAFESPISPYVGGHYHRHGSHSRPISRRPSSSHSSHSGTSRDSCDSALPLHARSPRSQVLSLHDADGDEVSALPGMTATQERDVRIPLISTTPASPDSETSTDADGLGLLGLNSPIPHAHTHIRAHPRTRRQRIVHALRHTLHVLFPTLHGFRKKSMPGMLASVLAAPAVLALTLTLPVQVTPRGLGDAEEKGANSEIVGGRGVPEGRLVDFEEEGVERVLTAEEDVQEEMHELKFNKWLMAVQVLLGPLFCAAVLFAGLDARREALLLSVTALAGGVAATLILVFANHGNNPIAQLARCSMGFLVAVVWIMAIADEVVNLLKTFGLIFGLSDAIIGLTVFAVGNSLADFVANVSVAAFAPVMGFSACFGGPMLNILLGVGVSGTAVIHAARGKPFTIDFSPTLLVSTVGLLALLLATLVCVPLNGYHLTRRWGVFLIVSYIIIMCVNVVVEVNQ